MKDVFRTICLFVLFACLAGCKAVSPLQTVPEVDLDRFMGDWYVIANIPTAIEKTAHNAVETYRMDANGTIATTFAFRDKSFDGKRKTYHPRAYVSDESNAIWGMQFVWPIKADYRIAYLDEDYSVTVIGRNKRDYVWLMARSPEMPDDRYSEYVELIGGMGYDTTRIRRVPQQW